MDKIPELSNGTLSSHSEGTDIRKVDSMTSLDSDSFERPLEASDLHRHKAECPPVYGWDECRPLLLTQTSPIK